MRPEYTGLPNRQISSGDGSIVVSLHGSEPIFTELFAKYPLKLLAPRVSQTDVAVVYIITYGGGLVGGDQVRLLVEAHLGVTLVMLSQGSTKVFKSRPGSRLAAVNEYRLTKSISPSQWTSATTDSHISVTTQNFHFTVSTGSALILLPNPVTCFRDASYNQIQRFYLSSDASLIVLDWITSGRMTLGEDWVFSRYYSVNEIWVDGKRIAKDIILLDTQESGGLPRRTLRDRLAPYSCYGMVILYGMKVRDTIAQLNAKYKMLSIFKTKTLEDMIWSLSPIDCVKEPAAILRVAGKETETVKRWLEHGLSGVEQIIGQDVYRRAYV